jgi:hypothetical protein
MEQVTINTAVNVKSGPLVKLDAEVDSSAYVVASLSLVKQATADVTILPANGKAALLVIQARKDADQSAAKVEVTPTGTDPGSMFVVDGSLLVANPHVVSGLAKGGPQKLSVKNPGTDDVTVYILAAFNS